MATVFFFSLCCVPVLVFFLFFLSPVFQVNNDLHIDQLVVIQGGEELWIEDGQMIRPAESVRPDSEATPTDQNAVLLKLGLYRPLPPVADLLAPGTPQRAGIYPIPEHLVYVVHPPLCPDHRYPIPVVVRNGPVGEDIIISNGHLELFDVVFRQSLGVKLGCQRLQRLRSTES